MACRGEPRTPRVDLQGGAPVQYPEFIDVLASVLMVDPAVLQPDSLLVVELGIDAVDLMRLAVHVEQATGNRTTGVHLPTVETVEELYWALVAGGDDGGDSVVALRAEQARSVAASGWMAHEHALQQWLPSDIHADVATMTGVLARRAAVTPDRWAIRMGEDGLTFRQLARDAARIAAALRHEGVHRGDVVVLALENSPAALAVLYGLWMLRATALPLPPQPMPERWARVVRHTRARVVVTEKELPRRILRRMQAELGDHDPILLSLTHLTRASVDLPGPPTRPEPGDVALLVVQSAATAGPIVLAFTHAAVLAHVRQVIPHLRLIESDVFVSFLPALEGLGLTVFALVPLYLGAPVVLLPRALDPYSWMGALQSYGGTVTAGTDFAYRFLLRFGGNVEQYDLSSLRCALVFGDQPRPETWSRVEAALSLPQPLIPLWWVDAAGGVVCSEDRAGPTVVWGRAPAGMEVFLDPTTQEVCARGPSQSIGVVRNPNAMGALAAQGGAVRTGWCASLTEDGRLQPIGREPRALGTPFGGLCARELEEVVGTVLGVHGATAVGLDDGGEVGQQIHVVVESDAFSAASREQVALVRHVREQVYDALVVRLAQVWLVPPGAVSRDSSGEPDRIGVAAQLRASIEGAASLAADPPSGT